MKVISFIHAENEKMGFIEEILEERGIEFEYFRFYENEYPESLEGASHLIIMGGPMGAYEDEEYPFLREELKIIKEALRKEIPVLGICLGAQLIAKALGARVYPFKKEIGWFEVRKVEDKFLERLPERMMVFQWHGDTFEIPKGAKLIYRGDEVVNQGFRFKKAVALQFHPEVTKEMIEEWLRDEDLTEEARREILRETEIYLDESRENCKKLIENFLKLEVWGSADLNCGPGLPKARG